MVSASIYTCSRDRRVYLQVVRCACNIREASACRRITCYVLISYSIKLIIPRRRGVPFALSRRIVCSRDAQLTVNPDAYRYVLRCNEPPQRSGWTVVYRYLFLLRFRDFQETFYFHSFIFIDSCTFCNFFKLLIKYFDSSK